MIHARPLSVDFHKAINLRMISEAQLNGHNFMIAG